VPNSLIFGGTVITFDDQDRVFDPGYVYIEGDRIAEVGSGVPAGIRERCDEVVDASGMVVIPGLVNAHTHLFQTFMRGLADDKPLLEWLRTMIWPMSEAMTEDDFYVAALLGCIENLKTGATTILSHHYIHTSKGNMDRVAEACNASGIRALLARGCSDVNYHPPLMEDPNTILAETTRQIERWNSSPDARIRFEFGPITPWGVTDGLMRRLYSRARELGVGIHIHIAETRAEVQMLLEERGCRHVEWMQRLGVLDHRCQLVHSVWLGDDEIKMAADAGATIVHCPTSNMYLASGIPPVWRFREAGVNVALATDGPGSNNSQDNLENLKMAACLSKVGTLNAMVLLPYDVLAMAVRGGAKAVDMEGQIGKLSKGAKADVVVVDLRKAHIEPVHSAASALVYNANGNDVHTVFVDGKLLVREGRYLPLDEKEVIQEARQRAHAVRKRAAQGR
jgi:5-methylthioadenosine/S-adenosylhomocysteine deaminase